NHAQHEKTSDSITDQHKEVQPSAQFVNPDQLGRQFQVDPVHAEKFGHLLVQDFEGRIKPMNTHTLELIRKIYKKDKYKDFNSDQWFLSMQIDPTSWANEHIIKVKNVSEE